MEHTHIVCRNICCAASVARSNINVSDYHCRALTTELLVVSYWNVMVWGEMCCVRTRFQALSSTSRGDAALRTSDCAKLSEWYGMHKSTKVLRYGNHHLTCMCNGARCWFLVRTGRVSCLTLRFSRRLSGKVSCH